jgi:hypothetical protein
MNNNIDNDQNKFKFDWVMYKHQIALGAITMVIGSALNMITTNIYTKLVPEYRDKVNNKSDKV